jgi:hypothetical protein
MLQEISRLTELLDQRVEERWSRFYMSKSKKNNSSTLQPLFSGKAHGFIEEKQTQ